MLLLLLLLLLRKRENPLFKLVSSYELVKWLFPSNEPSPKPPRDDDSEPAPPDDQHNTQNEGEKISTMLVIQRKY